MPRALLGKLAQPDKLVRPERQEPLARQELPARRVKQGRLAQPDKPARLVRQEPQEPQAKLVSRESLVPLE